MSNPAKAKGDRAEPTMRIEIEERVPSVVTVNAEGQSCMDARFWMDYASKANEYRRRALAAEAERDRLREALRQWRCVFCDGGVGSHREWPDYGQDCNSCNGHGIHPVARAALAAEETT